MARSWTTELKRAQAQGARIVCSVAPWRGMDVEYVPERRVWMLKDDAAENPVTFTGRECHAVGQNGGPWVVAKLLRF
ncbi:hypothetical protein HOS58_gp42 [Streptomyces phage Attoomi]|uniref:Uncharacterized protein n=1 Tax=Streptomyces phage Attoomi TaxID=2059881 RepID=A0A2H5BLL4_9CAUD|nr:hypothetical protein HOS58_gp42 [Streptomyces phage Attoomi]AUG87174.1 hypothetical protein SEA_ATTOOMI_42 [Streptomyces phage Attoomi]